MSNKPMRIMTLGYSNVGKTYFLGSLFKLSFETGQKGFSLQNQRFHDLGRLQDVYDTVTEQKGGAISTTMGLQTAHMDLRKGVTPVITLELTDIEGQALEPSRSTNSAEEIIDKIVQYDGLILLLEAPGDKVKVNLAKMQLAQMLLFAGKVLENNRGIPVTLVLNKIDALPKAKGVRDNIEQVDADLRTKLKKQFPNDRKAVAQALRTQRGERIGSIVKPIIDTVEIDEILEQFFTWVTNTGGMQIPNRVFPCTSLGFDNSKANESDSSTFVADLASIEPYGSAAAFLWTIYARLNAQNNNSGLTKILGGDPIAKDLLVDIKELHTS